MKHSITRVLFAMTLLLGARAIHAQAPADEAFKISLTTDPAQVRAGHSFDMIWRVSADNAQVLQVFLDSTDAFGPEHTWEHAGDGVFEATVTHLEKEPGFKEYELWAKLKRGASSRYVGETFQINVEKPEGDRDLAAFLAWMKQVGYSDEIVHIHAYDGTKPVVRKSWEKYFKMRKEDLEYRNLKTMPIVFVDVLATEDQATNELMKGQTGTLERYLTHMFGKPFKVNYEQVSIPYQTEFGEPAMQSNAKGDEWLKFDPVRQGKYARELAERITENRKLPPNAVMVRWAARKWTHKGDDLKVQDQTGSSPANSAAGFGGFGLGLYAHEWGHGLGLGHMFVTGPGSYGSRIWGLECIMNHSYVAYANREVGRLLSPLGRYVLEPKDGFADQATFAAEYNRAMAGTDLIKRRLEEIQTQATVATTMAWTTPWTPGPGDSVICQGLQNRAYEIQQLELHPGIKPGTYSLLVATSGGRSNSPKALVLKQNGKDIASTPFAWRTKVSQTTPHTITIENFLSLVIGSNGGGKNLYGIGKLINEKPLVVPENQNTPK